MTQISSSNLTPIIGITSPNGGYWFEISRPVEDYKMSKMKNADLINQSIEQTNRNVLRVKIPSGKNRLRAKETTTNIGFRTECSASLCQNRDKYFQPSDICGCFLEPFDIL